MTDEPCETEGHTESCDWMIDGEFWTGYIWAPVGTTELINAGTVFVQRQYRVNVFQACKAAGIHEGDRVEVFLKRVPEDD